MSNTNQSIANRTLSQDGREQIEAATASMNSMPAGIHAIATAYGDYSKKSFEDARLFVEKLSGVKSVDKAIELQSEFAKSSFETFMAEVAKDRRIVSGSCDAIFLEKGAQNLPGNWESKKFNLQRAL